MNDVELALVIFGVAMDILTVVWFLHERKRRRFEEKKRKPKCYGKYWTVAPTVTNLKKRGCLKCKYWTYGEDSCLINSPQPSRKKK